MARQRVTDDELYAALDNAYLKMAAAKTSEDREAAFEEWESLFRERERRVREAKREG